MSYLKSRLAHLVPVLLLVTVVTFLLTALLPGDPAEIVAGAGASEEQVQVVRDQLNLDDPAPVRYLDWVSGVATGDFGRSHRNNEPVLDAILGRLPVSIELMALSQLIAFLVAVPLAIATAYRAGGWLDRTVAGVSFAAISVPHFILAMLLIYLVSLQLGWLPASGFTALSESVTGNLRSLLLPALALAGSQLAVYQRLLRSDMVSTLQQDYVLMAQAKGLPTWYVLLRHALRPSSFSLITLAGVNVGRLIGGAVIIEVLFALPGIGQLTVQSIYNRDFLMLQGVVLFTALAYLVVNTLVDVLYAVIDPRIRHGAA